MNCTKCGGYCNPSKGFLNDLVSCDDFGNDANERGTTQSRTGDAKLVDCLKCEKCGHSFVPDSATTLPNFIVLYFDELAVEMALVDELTSESGNYRLDAETYIHASKVIKVLPLCREALEQVSNEYLIDDQMLLYAHTIVSEKENNAINTMLTVYPSGIVPVYFTQAVIKVLNNFSKVQRNTITSKREKALIEFITQYPLSTSDERRIFLLGYQKAIQ